MKRESHHHSNGNEGGGTLILPVPLRESEPLGALLDGLEQVLAQFVVRLVGGQVELVEARVRRGQPVGGAVVAVDLELLRPVHPLQRREALHC